MMTLCHTKVLNDFCFEELALLLDNVEIDRIGHGTYLTHADCPTQMLDVIRQKKIPIGKKYIKRYFHLSVHNIFKALL